MQHLYTESAACITSNQRKTTSVKAATCSKIWKAPNQFIRYTNILRNKIRNTEKAGKRQENSNFLLKLKSKCRIKIYNSSVRAFNFQEKMD